MKSWPTMEALADDFGISVRTGWRWLKKGKVRKELYGDGSRAFFLTDSPDSDGDGDMTSPRDTEREGGRDVIEEKGDRKRYRPNKIAFATVDPSQELVRQMEKTEIARLQADEEEALEKRKGNREHPAVAEMRARVESKKLNLELQELAKQEDGQRQVEYRRKMIEAVKLSVIPPGLRRELPPDILLMSYRLIDQALESMSDYSLDECIALAKSVVWLKYWGANESIYRIVVPAITRWTFSELEMKLKRDYESYVQKGFRGTYNDYLGFLFSTLTPEDKIKVSAFINMRN